MAKVYGGVYSGDPGDRDYYRRLIRYYCQQQEYVPIRIALANQGDDGVHDLYLELRLWSSNEGLRLLSPDDLLKLPDKPNDVRFGYVATINRIVIPGVSLAEWEESDDEWHRTLELSVVQPQRTWVSGEFYIGATDTLSAVLSATAYSSDSMPFALTENLELEVVRRRLSFLQILQELKVEPPTKLDQH